VRKLAPLLLALVAVSCSPPKAEEPKREKLKVSERREVLVAFRDYVVASYELLLLGERAPSTPTDELKQKLEAQKARELEARERLVSELEKCDVERARTAGGEGLKALAPLVRDVAVRNGPYAFVEVPGDPPSFAVVRVQKRKTGRLELGGEPFVYELVVHDETIVPDLATFRLASGSGGKGPVARLAVTQGKTIFLDRAAIERLGREVFVPRVDAYRATALAARDDAPFLAAANDTPRLVALAKDVLRWRSLEPLWSTISAFPKDEQVARFANDYEQREEVRAAIEARELELARAADPATPSPERLAQIERRAFLTAIARQPLGETANVLGLAQAALGRDGPAPPNLKAAASVIADLVRAFAVADAKGPEAGARAFGRLARASSEELRAEAEKLLGP
jgi:hypothetical protein